MNSLLEACVGGLGTQTQVLLGSQRPLLHPAPVAEEDQPIGPGSEGSGLLGVSFGVLEFSRSIPIDSDGLPRF